MSNRLRQCTGCKKRFDIDGMISITAGWFHNLDCVAAYALKKGKKQTKQKAKEKNDAIKKRNADFDRNFYDNDPKTRKKAAKTACHLYIRTRDKDEPCICCGRPLGKNFDAGHFLESGNYSHLRYDERNIHAQSVYCNQHKGGDSDDYEGRLRLKIGDEAVDEMKASKSKITKRTVDDYKEIEARYKAKLKAIS